MKQSSRKWKPTKWFSFIVMITKNIKVSVCTDRVYLIQALKREHHPLTIDGSATRIAGSKVFAAVYASSRFCQMTLYEESSNFCTMRNKSQRFIISIYYRISSFTSMNKSLFLPNLALHRKPSRLSLSYNIYYHSTLRETLLTTSLYIYRQLDQQHNLSVLRCNTNSYFYLLISRTSVEWNHLPLYGNLTWPNCFKKCTVFLAFLCTMRVPFFRFVSLCA